MIMLNFMVSVKVQIMIIVMVRFRIICQDEVNVSASKNIMVRVRHLVRFMFGAMVKIVFDRD